MGPALARLDFDEHHDHWEKFAEALASREMPPEKKPQPTDAQRQQIVEWIETNLQKLAVSEPPNPGRVTLRRLNKEEYRRTIRDLLGVDFNPEDFPADEFGYGFNNIGDVLSLSPMLMEKYLAASEQIVRKAISVEAVKVPKLRLRGDRFASPSSEAIRPLDSRVLGFYREGEAQTEADFIRTGEYLVRLRAYGELAGPEPPKLALRVAGQQAAVFEVKSAKPATYEARLRVEAGRQPVGVAYLNNYNDSTHPDAKLRGDRNVFLEAVEIEGPFDGKPEPAVKAVESWRWKLAEGVSKAGEQGLAFGSEAAAKLEWNFPAKDEYLLRIRASGQRGGDELPKLRVWLGERELGTFEISATGDKETVPQVRFTAGAGKEWITLAFINDYYDPAKNQDRNLLVRGVEIVGPINSAAPDLPASHTRLIPYPPAPGQELAAAREVLGRFAKRAYRRLVSDEEVARLTRFVELSLKNGGTFAEGVQAAVQAALCSPHFLFRWELDPAALQPGEVRNLGDFEVASRLSYFLWSSMPDDTLFALAERGELLKDGNLEKQVRRMLADGRARALVENFGGQWLQLHNLSEVDPDPRKFPKFSYELREDMKRETYAFLEAIIKEDRSILDLVDARFTFLNERLARHYDLDGVKGNEFRRVELPPDSPRGGILTMGSVLLATSMPTRTSPVIRGKWILEQILHTPPPPPPPNVPPLEGKNIDPNLPLRQKLALHRDNPDCAGCHAKIDPLGFALEQFDAIGAFRTMDGPNPVDAAAKLPNGTEINGAMELKRVIRGDRFAHAFGNFLLTYALGRGLERYDKRALDAILAQAKAENYKVSTLVTAIVKSDPFLQRKAAEKRVAAH
jgi:hypothetical protein